MSAELSDTQQQIESYLLTAVADGDRYFKSKQIAAEFGWSPSTIGVNMSVLKDQTTALTITRWTGQSSAATWHVSRDTPATQSARHPAED